MNDERTIFPIDIVREVAAMYHVTASRVVSGDQSRTVVAARHAARLKLRAVFPGMFRRHVNEFCGYCDETQHNPPGGPPAPSQAESPREIIAGVAARHKLAVADVLGESRRGKIVRARIDALRAVAEAHPVMSAPELGRLFRRNHTTVLHHLGRLSRVRPRASTFANAAE